MKNGILRKIVEFLQLEVTRPEPYGVYHFSWVILTFFIMLFLYKIRNTHTEKRLKIIISIYAITEIVLEIIKQIAYSVIIDTNTGLLTWSYRWQSFPFQLCSTPVIVCMIVLFMKKSELREKLLSYISYVTILGSIFVILFPWQCFVSKIFVSIHTMWLHCGSFVLSLYLIMCGEVKIDIKSWKKSIPIFFIFVTIANTLNIIIPHLVNLKGDRFDMFYISPYFTSTLAVFDFIYEHTPYPIFLSTYILSIILGSFIIYGIYKTCSEFHIKHLINQKTEIKVNNIILENKS